GTARVWVLVKKATLTLPHEGLVYHAAFSPDGRRVATASWDRTAQVWDVLTGRRLLDPPLKHSRGGRRGGCSPAGRRVAAARPAGTAGVWDATTGKPVTESLHHRDQVFEALFSPGGERLLTASLDGGARLWDTAGGQLLLTLEHPTTEKHQGGVKYAAF